MNEERLIAIETKIAHQEFLIEELNQVVYEQQKTIDQLEKKITNLTNRVLETPEEAGPTHQKPPHY